MGTLRYAILGLLNRKAMTGYDLSKEFQTSLAEFWHAKHSQLPSRRKSPARCWKKRSIPLPKPEKQNFRSGSKARAKSSACPRTNSSCGCFSRTACPSRRKFSCSQTSCSSTSNGCSGCTAIYPNLIRFRRQTTPRSAIISFYWAPSAARKACATGCRPASNCARQKPRLRYRKRGFLFDISIKMDIMYICLTF